MNKSKSKKGRRITKKLFYIFWFVVFISSSCSADRVAHYKMNDNAETATVEDSYGRYNGTYKDSGGAINTSTGSTTGKVNQCLSFDGDEYIDTGNTFQPIFRDSFSISLWVKPDDGQPDDSGWVFGVSTIIPTIEHDCVWIILSNAGTLMFQYVSNDNYAKYYSGVLLSDGQEDWHHIVMVANSTIGGEGGLVGYLDNTLITPHPLFKGNTSGVTFAEFTSTVNPYIGAENLQDVGAVNYYSGLIDDVRIYSEALTPSNVEFLYNNGDGTEADFIYYFLASGE